MTVSAKTADFPEAIWVGKKRGELSLFAFDDEGAALRWAADAHNSVPRYVIPFVVNPLMKARTATVVPAKATWDA